MTRIFRSILCTTAILPIASFATAEELKRIDVPTDSLEWIEVAPEVKIAPLWGDAESGAYGRFVQFAAGHSGALHSHANSYHAVVVQGTIKEAVNGEPGASELPAGSYYFSAPDEPHTTECLSDVPCVVYEQSDEKFDMKFIE